jgi:hypothetical protein
MNTSRYLLACVAAVAAVAAQAQQPLWTADGWRVHDVPSVRSAAEVRTELDQAKKGPNPWASSFNPLASFQSTKTRAQVQAEYIAGRDAVAAFNSEDSGSAYLAAHQAVRPATQLAGQPANAQ